MDGITSSVTAVFSAIKEFFGYKRERSALNNAVDMKQTAKAQIAQDEQARITKAIQEQDTEIIMKEWSE